MFPSFPLYKVRANYGIEDRGDFTLIFTRYDAYILDCKQLAGNYSERRTKLLSIKKDLPFKIYPLNERYTMLSQLVNTANRQFIDKDGNVIKYKPSKFFKVQSARVLNAERTWNGKYRLITKLPVFFVCDKPSNYIQYIKYGKGYCLYGLSDERLPDTRKKL